MNSLTALEKYFGYTSFRSLQENIINDIIAHKDVFVLMPTGGGKSLCYQIPSLVMDGTAIIISPLISLMKDQVDTLQQNGISASYLNSTLSATEQTEVLDQLANNTLSLLYLAPERLTQSSFLSLLKHTNISFFAIDEAHCISQWGHDFRPEYRQLDLIRSHFPKKPVMALTATATPRVKQDIIDKLLLDNAQLYQGSFNRQNLTYFVIPKDDAFSQTYAYITSHPGVSGIVYCQSRKTVERVAQKLEEKGIRVLPYHAGLSDSQRKENQEMFTRDDIDIIVATVAFGMGIDKPNVRFVIHYDLPKSLEHYYQETGRAGRDGLPSECIFYFNESDKFTQERFIAEKADPGERQIAHAQLQTVVHYAQSTLCRRKQLLNYFAEAFQEPCNACDNCVSPKETIDGTVIAQKVLSCVYRCGGRFGLAHVADVLAGSTTKRITERNHQSLSTHGILSDYSQRIIKTFIYELIQQGYLKQSNDQYGILSLTGKSKSALIGEVKVLLTKPVEISLPKPRREDTTSSPTNTDLFQRLRLLRKKLADEKNVPPYVVFSDATLREMASYIPTTKESFRDIKGVGEHKMKIYSDIFINEIKAYLREK